MRIEVGNEITGVTDSEAAKGRRDLADYLDNWWLTSNQKTPAHAPEKLDINWGAIKCQLELSVDQAKSPQIILRGDRSAPRSVREVLDKFLIDTCHVQSVDAHFKNEGIRERAASTATNIGTPNFDGVEAPIAQFRAQNSFFKSAPKKAPSAPAPTVDNKKGGPPSSTP